MRSTCFTFAALGTLVATACAEPPGAAEGELELTPVVTLSLPDSTSDLLGETPARAASGTYAARTLAGRGGGIAVFDSAGGFIRELKAQGRGPGEFSDLRAVGFGPGDTLWAVEGAQAHAFAPPPDLRFVRTVAFGSAASVAVTQEGFVGRGIFTTSGLVPPNLRNWDGEVVATFPPPGDITKVEAQMGPVTPANPGTMWFGHGERYELALIAAGGAVRQRIRRDLEWFPPDVEYTGPLNVTRPPARLDALATDATGRLFVLSRRAHPDWAPTVAAGPRSAEPSARRSGAAPGGFAALFEYVLEVFAPDGRLIASRVFDDGMRGILNGSLLSQVLEDESGRVSLRVWRVRVVEPSNRTS